MNNVEEENKKFEDSDNNIEQINDKDNIEYNDNKNDYE